MTSTIIENIQAFRDNIVSQKNRFHLVNKKNEFYIAPLLTPPKLGWFRDNRPEPQHYVDRLGELKDIKAWIKEFGAMTNISGVLPDCQTLGTRLWKNNDFNED